MAIESLIVFLPCSDIEKTSAYYAEVIGLSLVQTQAEGKCRIFDTGYGYIGFCQYDDGRPIPAGPTGVCISLNCRDEADVDRHYRRLLEKGVTDVSKPCVNERFNVYAAFTYDPDNYKVELQRILNNQELTGGGNR